MIDQDKFFIGSDFGILSCRSLWSGKELWAAQKDVTAATPTASEGKIYFPNKGTVTCVLENSGKMLWQKKLSKQIIWTQIIKSGNHLIIGGTEKETYITNASNGELITRLPIASSVSVQMALGNGFVALPDLERKLFIYNANVANETQANLKR